MTTQDIVGILKNGGGILLIILTVVQISPIKLNPWSWLARTIGKALNKDMAERIESLETRMVALEKADERRDIVNSRTRILRFGDEVLHHQKHTKDHFDQILRDIVVYERYCEEHPDFENGVTGLTSRRIKDVYERCLEEDDFL